MLLLNVFKLSALFTFEMVALILSVFLLAYVNKQQLNKWYKYAAMAITAFLTLIVICTVVNAFCHCSGSSSAGKSCVAQQSHSGGEHSSLNRHGGYHDGQCANKKQGKHQCTKQCAESCKEGKKSCSKEYSKACCKGKQHKGDSTHECMKGKKKQEVEKEEVKVEEEDTIE